MIVPSRRELYISTVQFDQELRSGAMSVLQMAPVARRWGADGVEYREVYWKDRASELPAIRDQLADMKLKASYATFTTLYNRHPEHQKQLMRDLEDAHALGASLMRVFPGERPGSSAAGSSIRAAAREVVDRATEFQMPLALENFSGLPGSRPREILEAIESFASPIVGVNIDFANYVGNGHDPIAAIRQLAPWTIYAHLKDQRHDPNGKVNCYLGGGSLPLREILAALDETDRRFPFCFEFQGEGDPEPAIAKSMAYLANLEASRGR